MGFFKMQRLPVALLLTLATIGHIVSGQNCITFSYPSTYWPTTCAACNGLQQSPINIVSSAAVTPSGNLNVWRSDLTLTPNASWFRVNFTLTNTGEAMRLNLNNLHVKVTGLNLNGTYIAAQMHWHWGGNSSLGSEHTLNGSPFVMEGHLVCYNSIYPSFSAALDKPYGIAVIAVWYQQSTGADNALFLPISNAATTIPYFGSGANVAGFNLYNLLPSSSVPYYRYSGSLTTPGCQQNVTWTILNTYYTVSSNQMDMIRQSMFFKPGTTVSYVPMVNNFRYTQPLNGRTVYYVAAAGGATLYACSHLVLAALVVVPALAKRY